MVGYFHTLLLLSGCVFVIRCANIGTPTGGDKDKLPPRLLYSEPPNYTTNFKEDEIYIYFDEYVTLDQKAKSIVISPYIKDVFIRPKTIAREHIYIRFESENLDTNATYTFNFGSSLKDFNEGNVLKGLQYVFSTGDKIDSLQVHTKVRDILESKRSKMC